MAARLILLYCARWLRKTVAAPLRVVVAAPLIATTGKQSERWLLCWLVWQCDFHVETIPAALAVQRVILT